MADVAVVDQGPERRQGGAGAQPLVHPSVHQLEQLDLAEPDMLDQHLYTSRASRSSWRWISACRDTPWPSSTEAGIEAIRAIRRRELFRVAAADLG